MECTPLHKLLVVDVIPLVTGSRDVLAEGFAARPEPHQVLLKMGYFCQWLEITGNYYTAAIAGSALQGDRSECCGRGGEVGRWRLEVVRWGGGDWRL